MKLILEQSEKTIELNGISFGAARKVQGELVFNTGMVGYVETLTDPSYRGQILVLTYPLQGNYGVPKGAWEAPQIQVQALVVLKHADNPSHHSAMRSLGEWLKSEGVPGIANVDTRMITKLLRDRGTHFGTLLPSETELATQNSHDLLHLSESVDMNRVLEEVAPSKVTRYGSGDLRILLIDTGCKENIVRSLVKRGATVIRAPWNCSWEEYLPEVDGIFLANGPGDPAKATELIERVKKLIEQDKPLFGICLGHQILSLAAGARTKKMKFGHRSLNQPVQDLFTRKAYITSQNHGYVVDDSTLSDDWVPWFVNLNDQSNEGIRHRFKPFYSVQFHPEASPGPRDTAYLFDDYLQLVGKLLTKTRRNRRESRLILDLPERSFL